MQVLFAVHDWGLGHATRDLVLIRALLDKGHRVTILSWGRALALLRGELGDRCEYLPFRDIPKPLSRRPAWFYIKLSLAMPLVFHTFRRERRLVAGLCRRGEVDCIVSDSRFGVWSHEVPSYLLFHSLRQIIPGRPRALERLVEYSQRRLMSHATRILVPDQADHGGLAGDLCHNLQCSWDGRVEYIGPLSSVQRTPTEPDVDYFISVSGAEPQRSIFEELVLAQARELSGRVVVALGRPDVTPPTVEDDGHVAVHSFMDRRQQQDMMNRSRLVVTRSGYTTLMELAELGKKALLIPTVGQSEQEYLAEYHERMGHMHTVHQSRLDLARDVAVAESYAGLPAVECGEQSVHRFLRIVGA
ncbi:MAG: glycosyltransferase [Gammaproteobacteria bacterium]